MGRRVFVLCLAAAALAAEAPGSEDTPPGCMGSAPLGRFRVSIYRPDKVAGIPIRQVSQVPPGAELVWNPVHLSPQFSSKGEIAVLVVPRGHTRLVTLAPHKAGQYAQWDLPAAANVVALVLGPDGLNMNKVKNLVAKDEDLLTQLAAYAQETSEVESLMQVLANSESSGGSANAALAGFSSAYGVAVPKLDMHASTNEQASTLLSAVMPTATTYDPLASGTARIEQTTGLAASVAGLFFGDPVGLAVGGTALVASLKSALFPNTEFRSTFAQSAGGGSLAFCTKNLSAKSRTRIAYLWAYRIPDIQRPVATLDGPAYLPLGAKSTLKIKIAGGFNPKDLARARDWRLVPVSGGDEVDLPAIVGTSPASLTLDLAGTAPAAGDYWLAATWDWDDLGIGTVHLRPYSDFAHVKVAPASRDRLVQGNGVVTVELAGADFEFLDKAVLERPQVHRAKPVDVYFELPKGPRRGEQNSLSVDIDTAAAGSYRLALVQTDDVTHTVPLVVLPPNPKLSHLPIHAHLDEGEECFQLEGTGLDRVEGITSDAGTITGGPVDQGWRGKIKLSKEARDGETFPVSLRVRGLENPLEVDDVILVVSPRPRIAAVRTSVLQDMGVELRGDELPAAVSIGFEITVDHLNDGRTQGRPRVDLGCQSGELRHPLALAPDERGDGAASGPGASLTFAGSGALYLSLDPAAVGYPGCELTAAVSIEPKGRSKPFVLGRVVRLPRLEKFTLTSESLGPNTYAGVLLGRDLDVIAKAGWDAQNGLPVSVVPAPVPGNPGEQTLRIAVPWPSPAPHAPLYIWLRGETTGRRTSVAD